MGGYNTYGYDRAHAVAYARRWALSRNPLFYDFTGIGGDCTNPEYGLPALRFHGHG